MKLATEEGFTLLHFAAGAGNLEMVKALLARGADPTARSNIGTTPYQMAIGTMVQAEIRKAMAARAGTGLGTLGSPAGRAGPATVASNGMCAMVRAERVNDGRSPAMRPFLKAKDAVWYNHPDELVGLIEDCVDVNQPDDYGWTLLHHAAERDRVAMARILLDRGARPSIRNKDGKTAAQLAASPEMRALLGPSAATPEAVEPASEARKLECRQKYEADAALASDSTGKLRSIRRWQQCLKTGLYW